jgi:flagellar biosynthesis protein FliP
MRRLIVASSLLLIMLVFTSLAIFRTQYLAAHGTNVSPVYFVIVNLFFFIVALLLSYFILPTWNELKENAHSIKLYKGIQKRTAEIQRLQAEKEAIKDSLLERNKMRIQIAHYAEYAVMEVKSMFRESLGIFQSTNLLHRSDKCVPLCFSTATNDIEVDRFEISFTHPNESLS